MKLISLIILFATVPVAEIVEPTRAPKVKCIQLFTKRKY